MEAWGEGGEAEFSDLRSASMFLNLDNYEARHHLNLIPNTYTSKAAQKPDNLTLQPQTLLGFRV